MKLILLNKFGLDCKDEKRPLFFILSLMPQEFIARNPFLTFPFMSRDAPLFEGPG